MARASTKLVSTEEALLIRYQLELRNRPRETKSGLQRLCAHYESGRVLPNAAPILTILRGLAFSRDVLVRRWTYKALALFGVTSDLELLTARLTREMDPENQTWLMAAIFALSKGENVRQICVELGVPFSDAMSLASLLFSEPSRMKGSPLPLINIDRADDLTLKWSALLAGYDKAPPHLFHPAYENVELLGQLNVHDTPEVSEYSVWALWMGTPYSVSDLKIPLHDLSSRPGNVRRWTNRLIVQAPDFLASNLPLFEDLRRDSEDSAREGLALGIRGMHPPGLADQIVDWHSREEVEEIQHLLLEHMATNPSASPDYAELLRIAYRGAPRDGGLRRRLLAASRGTPLWYTFKRLDIVEYVAAEGAMLHERGEPLFEGLIVDKRITAGRDIVAQNISQGEMIAIANQSVQKIRNEQSDIADVLERILEFAGRQDILSPQQAQELTNSVADVAEEPTPVNKGILLGTMKGIAAALYGTAAFVDINHLIQIVSGWL